MHTRFARDSLGGEEGSAVGSKTGSTGFEKSPWSKVVAMTEDQLEGGASMSGFSRFTGRFRPNLYCKVDMKVPDTKFPN